MLSKKGRGGKRKGAGRPRSDPPTVSQSMRLTIEQIRLLRQWGRGDASAGLRWLIDQAKHLVRKPDVDSCLISDQTGGQHP